MQYALKQNKSHGSVQFWQENDMKNGVCGELVVDMRAVVITVDFRIRRR
jgi:hypothetical protein